MQNILPHQFLNFLEDAMEVGATRALIKAGLEKPNITLAEAYRIYKRRKVDGWIRKKLIIKIKNGDKNSRVELDRAKCELLNKETMTHVFAAIYKQQ